MGHSIKLIVLLFYFFVALSTGLAQEESGAKDIDTGAVLRGIKTDVPDDPSLKFPAFDPYKKCDFVVQVIRGAKVSDANHAVYKNGTRKEFGHMSIYSTLGLYAKGTAEAYNGEFIYNPIDEDFLSNTTIVKFKESRPVISAVRYKIIHVTRFNNKCKGKGIISGVLQPQITLDYSELNPDVSFTASYYMKFKSKSLPVEITLNPEHDFGDGVLISAGITGSAANAGISAGVGVRLKQHISKRPTDRVITTNGVHNFTEHSDEVVLEFGAGFNHMKIGATCTAVPTLASQATRALGEVLEYGLTFIFGDYSDSEDKSETTIVQKLVALADVGHLKAEFKEPDWNLRVDAHCSHSKYHTIENVLNIENEKYKERIVKKYDPSRDY